MTTDDAPVRSDLDGHLGFLLRLAQVDAFGRFLTRAAMSQGQLTEATLLHLLRLNPGIRQGVLARHLRIKRAHMTKIVQGLDGRRLVDLAIPAEDRRSVTLTLTPTGEAALDALWPRVLRGEAEVPQGLTPEESELLRRLLQKLMTPPGARDQAQDDGHEP